MKILFVTSSYQGGGAEAVVQTLWEHAQQKCDVHWAVLRGGQVATTQSPESLHIINSTRTIFSFFKILKLLQKHNFDYVVSNLMYVNILMSIVCVISKTKLICVEHNVIYVPFLKTYTKGRMQRFLAMMTYRLAGKVVAVSEGVKHDLVQHLNIPRSSVEVIHNPVKLSKSIYQNTSKSGIGYIGSHSAQKNVLFLIKSYCDYHRAHDNPEKLFIAGNVDAKTLGVYLRIINKLNPTAREDIVFSGYVDRSSFYFARKVIVVPSYWEGFCNVVAESILHKTPVISTDCHSGPRDIVNLFGVGALIEIDNSSQLIDCLVRSLGNEQLIYTGDNLLSPENVWSKYYQLFKV
tara:strand:- start:5962 stop:7008 length:1047 start_codon:yes stop_codon:yes gene_type:complete